MATEKTLAKVHNDIGRGDLGKARERLHGLIAHYPNDLSLRRMLADVYARLIYPQMAGRYFYLEESKSPAISEACQAFEQSCGGDPLRILLALKFRGDLALISSGYAREKLEDLQKRCSERHGYYPDLRHKGRERWQPRQRVTRADRVMAVLFAAFLLLFVALAAIGLMVVVSNLLGLR